MDRLIVGKIVNKLVHARAIKGSEIREELREYMESKRKAEEEKKEALDKINKSKESKQEAPRLLPRGFLFGLHQQFRTLKNSKICIKKIFILHKLVFVRYCLMHKINSSLK